LRGQGKVVRNVRLENGAKTLDEPEIRELVAAAHSHARVPIPVEQERQFLIKSVSKSQRPRRPGKARSKHGRG
jgi:hypothetical protein